VAVGRSRFLEVKAVRVGGELILFEHRLDRDAALHAAGGLAYALVIHTATFAEAQTRDELAAHVRAHIGDVWCVPFDRVRAECAGRRKVSLQYHPGGEARACWRIPMRALRRLAGRKPPAVVKGTTIRGRFDTFFSALTPDQVDAAGYMRDELKASGLDVVLVDAPQQAHAGHKVRVVQGENPTWYRDLCAEYPVRRTRPRKNLRPDTLIRPREVLRSLQRLYSTGLPSTPNDVRLLPYVRAYAATLDAPEAFSPGHPWHRPETPDPRPRGPDRPPHL